MSITYPPELLPSPDEGETGVVIVMDDEQTGDLAARLRDNAKIVPHDVYSWLNPLLTESADEIDRLRTALREIRDYDLLLSDDDRDACARLQNIASGALPD